MIVIWTDVDDDKTINVNIDIPNINYFDWQRFTDCRSDEDIIVVLNDYLKKLDCTIEYSSGRPMMTTYPMYETYKGMFYYYLLKLNNQLLYYLINFYNTFGSNYPIHIQNQHKFLFDFHIFLQTL